VARERRVADARKHIGDRVGHHWHTPRITSSP
jgi:hypothetical protein